MGLETTALRAPIANLNELKLKPGAHVHLMGICGTAMASLAGLLKDRGYRVTGSDQNVYPPMSTQLEKMGIRIQEGYKRENLRERPDLVVVGNVISRSMEEAEELLASDIPFTSLPSAMGSLVIDRRHSIVVAGTHGKTTTTSLVSWIADQLGLNPGFMIGGIPKNFSHSYRLPKSDWFVIEGDEYDTAFFDKVPKFIHYRPQSVILTSVEFDHADIYRDLEHVKQAFLMLIKLLPPGGVMVTAAGDANIEDLLNRERKHLAADGRRVVSFAVADEMSEETSAPALTGADYTAQGVRVLERGLEFEIHRRGYAPQPIQTQLFGVYNVKNILAAFALLESLGFAADRIAKAIATFTGVKRRQEIIGTPNGITIIEDFAHHPTAVKQTVDLVKTRYPKAHVFAVFEARSATSRRSVFQDDYAEALSGAYSVLMPPAFNQTSIPEGERFSVEKLISVLKTKGVDANLCPGGVDEIVQRLHEKARPGDVILVMSNGGFGGIYEKLLAWPR